MSRETAGPPTVPEGVLPCGCTADVVQRLRRQAGLPARPERELWSTIEAHVAPHLGPLEGVLHDGDDGRVWGDVLVHRPDERRPSIDLVTAGMSAKRMRPPRAHRRRGIAPRAELLLRLAPDWSDGAGVTQALVRREGMWALQWLRILARLPHEISDFLGDAPGLDLRYRAAPLFELPGCPFSAVIAADPARFGRALPPLRERHRTLPAGRGDVRFLSLIPLFESELELAMDAGAERLFTRLAAHGVDDVVRVDRGPVA